MLLLGEFARRKAISSYLSARLSVRVEKKKSAVARRILVKVYIYDIYETVLYCTVTVLYFTLTEVLLYSD